MKRIFYRSNDELLIDTKAITEAAYELGILDFDEEYFSSLRKLNNGEAELNLHYLN